MENLSLLFNSPDEIRHFRKCHHMRQGAFWGRVGVSQSCGSRYETGREIPRAVQILLTVAYGAPPNAATVVAELRGWS